MRIWSVRTVRELALASFPAFAQSICAEGEDVQVMKMCG